MGEIFEYSIIIPHNNIPDLLNRCLMSIPERDDVEIIVVDDNSREDNYKCIVSQNHHNLKIYRLPLVCGAGIARNYGIEKAQGKWLIFADADDIFTEDFSIVLDKYKRMVGVYDIVAFPICENHYLNDSNSHFAERYNQILLNVIDCEKKKIATCCTCWSKMYNAHFVRKCNIRFDSSFFCNDIGFSVRTAVYSKSIYIDNKYNIYVYVRRHGSLTSINTKEVFNIRLNMKIKSYLFLKESNYFNLAPRISISELEESYKLYGGVFFLKTFWKLVKSHILFLDLYSLFFSSIALKK